MFEFFGLAGTPESVTVNGWVLDELGEIPQPDDSFEFQGLTVKILSTDGRRVTEIEVMQKPKAEAEAE